jgi:ABC-type bacteriocin/lantibiotic exporter with double-glycine peptidase domain
MILAAHGVECSAADLVLRLRMTPRGTSMLDVRRAAAEFGVPAKSWIIKPVDLSRIPLPAIAFVNKDHFVVIRRFIAPEVLEVDDPALGKLRWPMRAFIRAWSGETLVFDPAWTPL